MTEKILKYWGVITTLVIFCASCIGFVYASIYYNQFGIQYLQFADFSDLIKPALLSRSFFLSIFLIFALIVLTNRLPPLNESRKKAQSYTRLFIRRKVVKGIASIVLVGIAVGPIIAPIIDANDIIDGKARHYSFFLDGSKDKLICFNLIGITSNYVFLHKKDVGASVLLKSKVSRIDLVVDEPPKLSRNNPPEMYFERMEKWESEKDRKCQNGS